jgi:hypothetical protein
MVVGTMVVGTMVVGRNWRMQFSVKNFQNYESDGWVFADVWVSGIYL